MPSYTPQPDSTCGRGAGHGAFTSGGGGVLGSGDPPSRPRGRALTSATLGPGRGAEPWRAARGEGASRLGSSGRRQRSDANVEAADNRGATKALTAAMVAPRQQG